MGCGASQATELQDNEQNLTVALAPQEPVIRVQDGKLAAPQPRELFKHPRNYNWIELRVQSETPVHFSTTCVRHHINSVVKRTASRMVLSMGNDPREVIVYRDGRVVMGKSSQSSELDMLASTHSSNPSARPSIA